jgi:hypothetical protein
MTRTTTSSETARAATERKAAEAFIGSVGSKFSENALSPKFQEKTTTG